MKRRITAGIVITILFVACGHEAADMLGGALEDAGRMLTDAASSDASAQPLSWQPVTCVAEAPFTRTITGTTDATITTITETITPYAYSWDGEPEEWMQMSRTNPTAHPCYPYNLAAFQDQGYECTTAAEMPRPSSFNRYVGHPVSNGAGELRIECGRDTVTRTVQTDLGGVVQKDETTNKPYDPELYDYWIAKL